MTDSVHAIGEVTVAARSFREVVPSQKLQGKALERLRSHSVADALRFFAGVQVKDYGGVGGIKTVNVRSMGSHHVGVFYDGIQVSNAQNGQVDLGMFSLDNMEAVSLHNGQRSEIFQSAKDFACAGSVYMWTRRPRFASGSKVALRTSLKAGSFDVVAPALTLDLRVSESVSMSLSAEYLRSSGKYRFRYHKVSPATGLAVYDTTATRNNGDIEALRTEAALFASRGAAEWYVKFYRYKSNRGVPGAIVNNVWRRGERVDDDNRFAQGTLTLSPQGPYRLKALAKWATYRTHYENRDTAQLRVDNHYHQREAYLSLANLWRLNESLDASFSVDAHWNDMTADLYDFALPERLTLMASAAVAGSWRGLKAQASVVVNAVSDKAKRRKLDERLCHFVPALSLSWRPALGPWAIRAFAKRSFRMPTFNDLYYAEIGNAALSPERASQFNVGVAYDATPDGLARNISARADLYYNNVKDKIVAYPKGQQFRWTMLNLGRVDICGLDVSASASLVPTEGLSFVPRLQYTWQHAIDVTNKADSYYRHQIPYVPTHSGTAALQAEWRGWALDYAFVYTGERYSQQENTIYNYVLPWYTSDLVLSWARSLKSFTLKLQAEVNNLLDQDYDVIVNYPMPGRNYKLTIRLSFGQ